MNKALVVILMTITLDAVGIGLIFPILPALLREVTGAGDVSAIYGVMVAVYALMQFIFAPVLGVLSDRYGRRPIIIISLAGAAIDYLIMAFTPYLWVLLAGRMIAGVTAANMAVASAYITDISSEEERAQRFGLFHACFGIGFIVGPIIGGLLGDVWVRAPFLAAAALNGINCFVALFILPESHKGSAPEFSLKSLNPFRPLRWVFGFSSLLPLIGLYVVINFIGQSYGTIWVLFVENRFLWGATMVGISLAGYGFFHALAQMFLVGPATKLLGERGAIAAGLVFEGVGCCLLVVAFDPFLIFTLLPLFALGGIGLPALQSMMTKLVDADRQGALQGVLSSLVSLTAVVGPLFYSFLYFGTHRLLDGTVWMVAPLAYLLCIPLVSALNRQILVEEP